MILGLVWCEHEWACRLDVKKEVLSDSSNTFKGVNCQRDQDQFLVKDVADGCDTCCWVGLVVTTELLLFVFLSMRIGIGKLVRGGVEDRARRCVTDGDIEINVDVGACVVDLRLGGRVWVQSNTNGSCMWVRW